MIPFAVLCIRTNELTLYVTFLSNRPPYRTENLFTTVSEPATTRTK
jgi:hypothetical protein